jgi:hypothetical protein
MPKRPTPPGSPINKNGRPQDRQDQSRSAQEARLAHFRSIAAARAEKERQESERIQSRPIRVESRFADALSTIPLWRIGESRPLQISAAYQRLVAISLRAMNNESSETVLCWPSCDPSPAAIAALLVAADCAAAGPLTVEGYPSLERPFGLRALIYPYARTAHRALRHLYVDKDFVGSIQTKHQVRNRRPDDDPACADYHRIVARVKTLNGVGYDGQTYDELRHPCLDELMPSGPCSGNEGRSRLLWRIGTKTDLRGTSKAKPGISRTGEADDPVRAPFYLFGLSEGAASLRSLGQLPLPLDIVFLDLDYTGRNRLGRDWQHRIKQLLDALRTRFPNVPVVALTDDPYSFDALRFDVFGAKANKKSARTPGASSVVFSPRSDIAVADEPAAGDYSIVSSWECGGFAGASEQVLAELRAAARKAYDLPDRESGELLRSLASILRRCVGLPGSLVQLGDFCTTEVGSQAAADLIAAYRVAPLIRALRDSTGPFPQLHGEHLRYLCDQVERVADNANVLTPMTPLLIDTVKRFLRSSSRTLIVFPNDMLADFATHALATNAEIGEQITDRLENGMIVCTHRAGLADFDTMPPPQRNHIKRLILVAPSRSSLTSVIAREWLPETVIVLADADSLAASVRDAARLGALPELGVLAARMRGFSESARGKVDEIAKTIVVFNRDGVPEDELEFPVGGVVDLAGDVKPDQRVIEFTLDGGQVLIAKPGTKLVVHDRDRAVASFAEEEAAKVEVGERICVIGDAFLEMARPLLNISVRAAEEIRTYHALVLERFAQLPGADDNERLAELLRRMPGITTQRARYWIDLLEQQDVPLHEVVPHAPRDFSTFVAFMAALGVGEAVARRYWTWAVIAQRASRLRAAFSFHEAYRGILVDPYAAQSDNPTRAMEVRRLRAAAENFVAKVIAKRERRGQNARA